MKDAKIFDKKYADGLAGIRTLDLSARAGALGATKQGKSYVFDFFNRRIAFDGDDFLDLNGHAVTTAVKVLLCDYLTKTHRPHDPASNRMVTFREFRNAGPLFSRFSENTGKIISTSFAGRLPALQSRCQSIGGIVITSASYDLSIRFQALKPVSVFLNFNDADELMPANAVFLFHADAEAHLELESLSLLCTYLTGCLIQNR